MPFNVCIVIVLCDCINRKPSQTYTGRVATCLTLLTLKKWGLFWKTSCFMPFILIVPLLVTCPSPVETLFLLMKHDLPGAFTNPNLWRGGDIYLLCLSCIPTLTNTENLLLTMTTNYSSSLTFYYSYYYVKIFQAKHRPVPPLFPLCLPSLSADLSHLHCRCILPALYIVWWASRHSPIIIVPALLMNIVWPWFSFMYCLIGKLLFVGGDRTFWKLWSQLSVWA